MQTRQTIPTPLELDWQLRRPHVPAPLTYRVEDSFGDDAVHVVRVVVVNEEGKILVGENYKSGEIELPGGKVEPGEMLIEAAERETPEESGVTIRPRSEPRLHTIRRMTGDGPYRNRMYLGHGLIAEPVSGTPIAGEDMKKTWWEHLERLGTTGILRPDTPKVLGAVGLL